MNVFTILAIFCITWFYGAIGQAIHACPDNNNYIKCADYNGECNIPDDVKAGYISYGSDGHWILMPFTNKEGSHANMRYRCLNQEDDQKMAHLKDKGLNKEREALADSKKCCYTKKTLDTGFGALAIDPTLGKLNQIANPNDINYRKERPLQSVSDDPALMTIRYGANNQYVYRPTNRAIPWCADGAFGDPVIGTTKQCEFIRGSTSTLEQINKDNEWVNCGNQDGWCTGLDTGAAQWVRYGDNDRWLYQLVIARDGQIRCNDAIIEDGFFIDSYHDHTKRCQRAPAYHAFGNVIGEWVLEGGCIGDGCIKTISITVGITGMSESETTEEWGKELSASVEVGFSFASASVSATASKNVAQRALSQTTRHEERTVEVECNGYLYQWVMDGSSSDGFESKPFGWKSGIHFCSQSAKPPQCPVGYCKEGDAACHECTEEWKKATDSKGEL